MKNICKSFLRSVYRSGSRTLLFLLLIRQYTIYLLSVLARWSGRVRSRVWLQLDVGSRCPTAINHLGLGLGLLPWYRLVRIRRDAMATNQLRLGVGVGFEFRSRIHPLALAINQLVRSGIKTHGSESRGQGGSTLRRPLDERTWVFYKNKPC